MSPTLTSLALLALICVSTVCGREFHFKDNKGQICAQVKATFTIHFLLLSDGKAHNKQELDQDFDYLYRGGDCDSFFSLMFGEARAVRLEFRLVAGNFTTKELTLHPTLQFQPFYVFGDRDAEFMDLLFEDFTENPVLPDITYSYQCDRPVTRNYVLTSGTGTKYTYEVSIDWSELEVQVTNMPGGEFGPAVTC